MSVDSLRRAVLEKRRALKEKENLERSHQVIERFFSVAEQKKINWKDKRVGVYRSMKDELRLTELESRLRALGARLFFPKVGDRDQKALQFFEAHELTPFQKGPYGIEEPAPDKGSQPAAELDFIFVPAVALGQGGERIGMGAGYYDRYLSSAAPSAVRVALAFDFQLFEKIEQNPWDQKVHWIITETSTRGQSR